MDGDGRIAQHGLGTGGGDDDVVARLELGRLAGLVEGDGMLVGDAISQRVAEVPEIALQLRLHDLKVGDGGEQLRVPVDETLVLVDQPFAVELDEDLQHRLGQAGVHGEAFARPVAGGAEALQLADDGTARLGLPLPDALDELLAADLTAMQLPFGQLALHHHLRSDAGMIESGLPEHVEAAHALQAHQNVLQRVVERVAHVQRAGDVRRRNDDGERVLARLLAGACGKRLRIVPSLGDARLDVRRFECLFQHDPTSFSCRLRVSDG